MAARRRGLAAGNRRACAREELRYDDATLLLLRVTADTAAKLRGPCPEPSDYSDATPACASSVEQTSGKPRPVTTKLSPVASAPCARRALRDKPAAAPPPSRLDKLARQPHDGVNEIYALRWIGCPAGAERLPPLPERAAAGQVAAFADLHAAAARLGEGRQRGGGANLPSGRRGYRPGAPRHAGSEAAALRKYREKFPPRDP